MGIFFDVEPLDLPGDTIFSGPSMVKKLTSEKQAKQQAITKAILSLSQRRGQSNRQVGSSLQLSCRSNTVLDLARRARSRRQSPKDAAALAERMREMEAYNVTLRQRVVEMQAQIHKLRNEKTVNPLDASLHEELHNLQSENADLRAQLARLKEEVQSASKSVNIAWQQGYLAGQLAGQQEQAEQKGFIETLAEAAQAATEYGATTPAAAPASTATAIEEPVQTEDPYVVESPDYLVEALQLTDPDVLNDPFTAKLLGALGTEIPAPGTTFGAPEEPLTKPIVEPAASAFNCEPDGIEVEDTQHVTWYMNGNAEKLVHAEQQADTMVDVKAQASLLHAPEEEQSVEAQKKQQEHLKMQGQNLTIEDPEILAAASEETSQFSADELHTLFRNKYVRGDSGEPVEKLSQIDPAQSGTFPSYKKFVGANKPNNAEPLPTASRVFPPDIRKACKLLGVNPEEITKANVNEAWKKEMAKPGVHPDTGGDTEMAIYLNTAKDTLMRWLEDQAPKLGKKFGATQQPTRDQPKPKKE
jgi:PAS domain-containing protein